MKTAMLIVAALAVAAPAFVVPAFAQTADEKLAAACQDKNAGDKVMIDGKELTCN